jgi:hypothetical protein
LHPGVRANADVCVTFGQEDPLQVDAICEHYFSRLPKPDAIRLLYNYAFRDDPKEGDQRYALIIDVTNRDGLPKYEMRINQVCFKQSPPFIIGGPDWWGEEYYQRLKYIRDAYHGAEKAGDDDYFESAPNPNDMF